MFKLFKPKPPLKEAIGLIHQAVEIAYQYKRDKDYQFTRDDLISFERVVQALWEGHTAANYIFIICNNALPASRRERRNSAILKCSTTAIRHEKLDRTPGRFTERGLATRGVLASGFAKL